MGQIDDLLRLVGVARKSWKNLSHSERLQYIKAAGLYAGDFATAGLLNFGESVYRKGYSNAKSDYYQSKAAKRARYEELAAKDRGWWEWIKGGKVRGYVHSEHVKLPDNPNRPRIDIYGTDRNKNLRGSYDETDYGPIIRQRVEAQREATKRKREEDENDAWVMQGAQEEPFSTINYSGPNQVAPEVLETTPTSWDQSGTKETMNNPIQKYRGTRTSVQVLRNRRASKYATLQHAKRMFWMSRFPTLTMRTYLPAGDTAHRLTAGSGYQVVAPDTQNYGEGGDATTAGMYEFPLADWCFKVLRRMHIDMTHHSANGHGEIHTLDNDMAVSAANQHRNGLTLLDTTRTYTMMNVSNVIGFVEVYELVWKGEEVKENYDNTAAPATGVTDTHSHYHPAGLWEADLKADDPDWGTSASSGWTTGDKNLTVTTPGNRPTGKNKLLWKYWDLEKKTKYVLGAGQTVLHTVHLPAMYIAADDIYQCLTSGINAWTPFRIKNKTRHVMMIFHGQLGFEKSATATSEGRIETVDASLSIKMRQITRIRIQEANYKKAVHFTCLHDLATDKAEHVPLPAGTGTVLQEDPMDGTTAADQY